MQKETVPLTSIRGFAAFWVLMYHYHLNMEVVGFSLWPELSRYGFTGVDIFFVLSGFIMTAVHRGLAWGNVGAFLARRVFRIYPMHLAVLGAMLLLWLDAYIRFDAHSQAQELRWLPICALLLQPFFYHRLMWNSVTWSISVELLCYLLFPLAIVALRSSRLQVICIIIFVLASIEPYLQDNDLAIWGGEAVARGLVGFGLGMALRLASEWLPGPSTLIASFGECFSIGGIILCAAIGFRTFIPDFAAALILNLSYDRGIVARSLHASWFVWLGKISFSLYLIHEPLIGLAWSRFPATCLPFGHYVNGLLWTLGVIVVCVLLSTATWLLIEDPFRRLGGRVARRLERNNPPESHRKAPAAISATDVTP